MTAHDDRIPTTTARAIAVVAAVGAFALTVSHPTAAAGGVLGFAAVLTTRGFDGSHRRAAAASALCSVLALGSTAVVAVAADPVGATLTIASAIVGVAVAVVVAGGPTRTAIDRSGSAALVTGVAAGVTSILWFAVSAAGGLGSTLATALWQTGDGVTGLFLWCFLAGVAVVIAVFAVPPAALATPAAYGAYAGRRTALAWWIGAAVASAIGLAVAASILSWVVPLDPVLAAIAGSVAVRGLLAAATAVGLATAAVGAVVRSAWSRSTGRENVVVPIVAGGLCGVIVPGPIAVVAAGGAYDLVAGLFAGATLVLGAEYVLARITPETTRNEALPPTAVIAAALVVGGLVGGATVDAAPGLATVRASLVPLVAIAAGLFVYDVGRYGRTLGREIGRDGASRRPQLVRLGWSGAVASIGVPVASIGVLAATALAPTLSVPATAGVLGGLAALVAGGWLLFR